MSEIKISVVMPVHNAAEYIESTLNTILNQTLKEIEIIIVDDNSADNSVALIEQICMDDSRVRVVVNPINKGGGGSRNVGLSYAVGDYIIFLDDDDYAQPDMLEKLYLRAIKYNCDVTVCRCNSIDFVSRRTGAMEWSIRTDLIPQQNYFSSNDIKKDIFHSFIWWPWDKLFNRKKIIELGLSFQEITSTNDLYFVCAFMLCAENISIVDEELISHSITRTESLSSKRYESWHCAIEALDALYQFMLSRGLLELRGLDFSNYVVNFLEWHINTISGESYFLIYEATQRYFEKLHIESELLYTDLLRSSFERIKSLSAADYLFFLKDKLINELDNSNVEKNNLMKKIDVEIENNNILSKRCEQYSAVQIQYAAAELQYKEKLDAMHSELVTTRMNLAEIKDELDEKIKQLSNLTSSTSWKITAPLRRIRVLFAK